ncbi:MAG: Na+/H+ antiporter subunit C [Flavobacteriales bacterium]|nr:Na+/H+ antiporter subunit C [Flavobacteriales bacterium]
MGLLLALLAGTLYAAAFYMLLRRSLAKLIIGLVLLGHASNLCIFTLGRLSKGRPPFVEAGADAVVPPYADPLPQALILTAIVIGFGIQAFAIVLIKRVHQETRSDDLDRLQTADDTFTMDPEGKQP